MEPNKLAIPSSLATSKISEPVPFEDAYAIILLLDEQVAINKLDNLHNCRAVSTLDELRTYVAGAGPRVQSKPVIVLSRGARPRRDYLVKAVASHWRHAGKYVLSRVKCTYLSKVGELQIEPVLQHEMHRTALLPGVLTMPVREALGLDGKSLVFVPSDGFTVCVPDVGLLDGDMGFLEEAFEPQAQSASELERLAKTGALNHSILQQLSIREHWPVAHEIAARLDRYQRLVLGLESRELSKQTAETTIALIERHEDDLLYLPEKLSDFLLALSERGDILIDLDVPTLESYIALSRQCSKADQIAVRLHLVANDLSRVDPRLIFPLFEFFACSLSQEELNAAYCFATRHFEDEPGHCIRLGQSMRRFAHESSLAQFLTSLYRERPKWLGKRSVLRSFRPLLASPLLPALIGQLGEKTVSRIDALVNIEDRFRAAVRARDSSLAKEILSNEDELATVDFIHWMNSIRGLSNELRDLSLSVTDLRIPGISNPAWQKLAAARLYDLDALQELRTAGLLNEPDHLNAVAHSMVGDNTMLNRIICEKYASSPYAPVAIQGGTASEVFRNAAKSTRTSGQVHGPLVSVIISAYNPDLGLMRIALDSIIGQTWKNVELIIVDDASGKETAFAIQELSKKYKADLIRMEVNSGPYIGRNLAIAQAKGEFIAIQDADDWSHPERLAAQLKFLQDNPTARAVTTEHIRINAAGHVSLESGFRIFGEGPMTSVFRSEVFQQIGCFAAVRSRGDLEMYKRIAAYYGHQANAILPLPMALCYADSRTLSHSTADKKGEHIQLFHTNISRLPSMTSLFRDGIPLNAKTAVPMMLRAPDANC